MEQIQDAEEGDTPLRDAVRLNNIELVLALLDRSSDVNLRNLKVTTALHEAVRIGNLDMVILLIKHSPDVNLRTRQGYDLLRIAAAIGRVDIAELLINHGAEVNLKKKESRATPLHLAVKYGCEQMITLLLNQGADINARNHFQENALHTTTKHGQLRAAEILLDYCANVQRNQPKGEKQSKQYTKLLRSRNCVGATPFRKAIFHREVDIVELLLKNKAQLESFDAIEDEVLQRAIYIVSISPSQEGMRLIEILLKANIFDINRINHSGETPLHVAMQECRFQSENVKPKLTSCIDFIVKMLLDFGVNANQTSYEGFTALMIAASNGCDHFVKILLEWKRDNGKELLLDLRDQNGQTALMKAVINRHVHVVEHLVESGASVNVHDYCGFTPLHAAIYEMRLFWAVQDHFGHGSCKQRLNSCSDDRDSMCMNKFLDVNRFRCANVEYDKLVKEKIVNVIMSDRNLNENAIDFAGNTPIDLAHQFSLTINVDTFQALLHRRCNTNKMKIYSRFMSCNEGRKYQTLDIDVRDRRPTLLQRIVTALLISNFDLFKFEDKKLLQMPNGNLYKSQYEEWLKLTSKVLQLSLDDREGRTVFHHIIMLCSRLSDNFRDLWQHKVLRDIWQQNLLKVIDLNAIDIYGRTPLHYAENEKVYFMLVENGAHETTKDVNGHSPKCLKTLRSRMLQLGHIYEATYQVEGRKLDSILQRCTRFSERLNFNRRLDQITEEIEHLVERIASAIGARDSRLTCKSTLVGSASDGTKTKIPGDFDFDITLQELSKRCEVFQSPVTPSGYRQLKRKMLDSGDCKFKSDNFDAFFNDEQLLLSEEVNCRFKIILGKVLCDPDFWSNESTFKLHESFYISDSSRVDLLSDRLHGKVCLRMIHPLNDLYFDELSLDLVPCIHLENWWPDEALHNVTDYVKSLGCNLVFDRPQRFQLWVPFAETYTRISFAQSESYIIKNSSRLAKIAYLIAKEIVCDSINRCELSLNTYILKTCFLYCIEALDLKSRDQDSEEQFEHFTPKELELLEDWVERILFCYAEFGDQDFLPCYLMPSFSLPIDMHFKSNHLDYFRGKGRKGRFVSLAHKLYTQRFPDASNTRFTNPTIEPLRECFNRNAFIKKLCGGEDDNDAKGVDDDAGHNNADDNEENDDDEDDDDDDYYIDDDDAF